jgi:hypothetical protein
MYPIYCKFEVIVVDSKQRICLMRNVSQLKGNKLQLFLGAAEISQLFYLSIKNVTAHSI